MPEPQNLHGISVASCTAHTPTTDGERRDARFAGVADWKTAQGGEYEAYAHRLGGPLSSRPLLPRPYKAAAPKGLAFCFLNY